MFAVKCCIENNRGATSSTGGIDTPRSDHKNWNALQRKMRLEHIVVCRNDRADLCRNFFCLQDRPVHGEFSGIDVAGHLRRFLTLRAAWRTQAFAFATGGQRNEIIIDYSLHAAQLVRLRAGAYTQEIIAEMQRRFQVPNPVTD